jgi:multidrug efflux pump subunit AcrA (membrane-fusion protein)
MSKIKSGIKKMRIPIVFLIVIIAVAAAVAVSNNKTLTAIPELATAKVEVRNVKKIVSVDGNLVGKTDRKVFFPSNSQVESIKVSVGDKVKKKQVVAVVQVTGAFGTTNKKIKAPIAGTIVAINYNKGDFASPTQAGVQIVDQSSYKIELPVNENDIFDLKTGQQATIILPAYSLDTEFKGKVTHINPAPISTVGAINYLSVVEPKDLPRLAKIGMSVSVDILAAQETDVLAIPESFLIERDDALFVKKLIYKNEDKTDYEIVEVEVKVGLRTNELVEIKSGLKEAELLIEPSFTEERSFSLLTGN